MEDKDKTADATTSGKTEEKSDTDASEEVAVGDIEVVKRSNQDGSCVAEGCEEPATTGIDIMPGEIWMVCNFHEDMKEPSYRGPKISWPPTSLREERRIMNDEGKLVAKLYVLHDGGLHPDSWMDTHILGKVSISGEPAKCEFAGYGDFTLEMLKDIRERAVDLAERGERDPLMYEGLMDMAKAADYLGQMYSRDIGTKRMYALWEEMSKKYAQRWGENVVAVAPPISEPFVGEVKEHPPHQEEPFTEQELMNLSGKANHFVGMNRANPFFERAYQRFADAAVDLGSRLAYSKAVNERCGVDGCQSLAYAPIEPSLHMSLQERQKEVSIPFKSIRVCKPCIERYGLTIKKCEAYNGHIWL